MADLWLRDILDKGILKCGIWKPCRKPSVKKGAPGVSAKNNSRHAGWMGMTTLWYSMRAGGWAHSSCTSGQCFARLIEIILHYWVPLGITQGASVNHGSTFSNMLTWSMLIKVSAVTPHKQGTTVGYGSVHWGCCHPIKRETPTPIVWAKGGSKAWKELKVKLRMDRIPQEVFIHLMTNPKFSIIMKPQWARRILSNGSNHMSILKE